MFVVKVPLAICVTLSRTFRVLRGVRSGARRFFAGGR